jgi:two-component system phosphate regulon response regulator PhoB
MLRVEAVLRRSGTLPPEAAPPVLVSGAVRVDASRHEVTVARVPVVLTLLEFKLLRTLVERADTILTREKLLTDVWGIAVPIETRTIDTHIKRLRQKLGPEGERIETVRGVGYRLRPAPGAAPG